MDMVLAKNARKIKAGAVPQQTVQPLPFNHIFISKDLIDNWIDYYNNDCYRWQLAKLSPN